MRIDTINSMSVNPPSECLFLRMFMGTYRLEVRYVVSVTELSGLSDS